MSQYAHTAWRIRDGFTRGTIRAIAQTSDGDLWLGTARSLRMDREPAWRRLAARRAWWRHWPEMLG